VKRHGEGDISPAFVFSVLLVQQTIGALCFPISKYGLEYIDAFVFAFYRFVISSIVLFAFVKLKRHAIPIDRKDYPKIIGLGALIIPFNQTLYLWGQSMTAAGHGAFLFATVPIWIFLLAITYLKEKATWQRTLGVLVALAGVIIIMTSGETEVSREYLLGDVIILVAVVAWAGYTVFGKPLVQKYGALRVTAYSLISGSIIYFPYGLYVSVRFDHSSPPLAAWGSVLFMAIGTSFVAYVLWYWVLKHMEASRIAVLNNFQPVLASVVAYFWLGEPLGATFIVGGLVILAGVLVAEWKRSKKNSRGVPAA